MNNLKLKKCEKCGSIVLELKECECNECLTCCGTRMKEIYELTMPKKKIITLKQL